MEHIVQAAGNAKTAIKELQGLSREVFSGAEAVVITGITLSGSANASILASGHGMVTGDMTLLGGTIVGTVELQDTIHVVTKTDVDNITLDNTDSSDYTAWSSGGTVNQCLPVPGMKTDDLLFSVLGFDGNASALADQVKDYTADMVITAKTKSIAGVTLSGTLASLEVTGHGLVTGDYISISSDIGGAVELASKGFIVTKTDADNFTLNGVLSGNVTAYTSGGTIVTKDAMVYADVDLVLYRLLVDFYTAPEV